MAAGQLTGQRVLIIGHGAIGTVLAAALAEAGARIEAASTKAPQAGHRQLWRGDVLVSQYEYSEVAYGDIVGQHDFVVLSPKTTALSQLATVVRRAVGAKTTLVSAMNGVPWWFADGLVSDAEAVLAQVPQSQVVGCVINLAATRKGAETNQVQLSGTSSLTLGAAVSTRGPAKELVSSFSREWLTVKPSADIRSELWRKLLNNASVNPISALCMATCGEVTGDQGVRQVIRRTMFEVLAVGRACGLSLEEDVEQRIEWSASYGEFKTSMLQDLEAGRELEVDALLSSVVRLAKATKINVPTLETVTALVRLRDELSRKKSAQHAIAIHP